MEKKFSETEPVENWDLYRAEIDRVNAHYAPYLEKYGEGAFAYGKFALQTLIALNGGAIIATPAVVSVVGLSNQLPVVVAVSSYIVGLVLAMISVYFSHLNYLHLYQVLEERKHQEYVRLSQHFNIVDDRLEEPIILQRRINRGDRIVALTFWVPHVLGVFSLVAFCFAGFMLGREAIQ